jgi:hypothetical protein
MERKTSDFYPATTPSCLTATNVFFGFVFCSASILSFVNLGMKAHDNHWSTYTTFNFFSLALLTLAVTATICSFLFMYSKFFAKKQYNHQNPKGLLCWMLTSLPALFLMSGMLIFGASTFILTKNMAKQINVLASPLHIHHQFQFWGIGLLITAFSILAFAIIAFYCHSHQKTKYIGYILLSIAALFALYASFLITSPFISPIASFKTGNLLNNIIFITSVIIGFSALYLLAPIWIGDAKCVETKEKKIRLTKIILPISYLMGSLAIGSYMVHKNFNADLCMMIGWSIIGFALLSSDLMHRWFLNKYGATFTLSCVPRKMQSGTNIIVPALFISGTTLMSIATVQYGALVSAGDTSLSINCFNIFISGVTLLAIGAFIEFFQAEQVNNERVSTYNDQQSSPTLTND